MLEWTRDDDPDYGSDQCICSQHISNNYCLKNNITGWRVVVGSECIDKFGDDRQREVLHTILRRENYKGEKQMCCYCTRNTVARDERAIPLCEACISAGINRPSERYLSAFGVPCSVCKLGKIVPGLVTCCQRCKQSNCKTCNAPLHNSTKGMENHDWFQLCPYCICPREVGDYCTECRVPIKKNNQGWITCYKCSRRREQDAKSRVCQDCNSQLPDSHPTHWKKCKACKFPQQQRPTKLCPTCKEVKMFASDQAWCKQCLDCHYKK